MKGKNEIGEEFEKILREYNDPHKKKLRELEEKRRENLKDKLQDLGLE